MTNYFNKRRTLIIVKLIANLNSLEKFNFVLKNELKFSDLSDLIEKFEKI